jgi:hypothetical protein
MVLQRRQYRFHAGLNFRRIIAGAIPGQQEFEDKGGHVRPFLDPVQQILPDDFPIEDRQQFLI